MALPAVAFYVLETAGAEARLHLACRIIDKAWKAGHRVLVLHQDATELRTLDDLLWTFGGDLAFLPHEIETAAPLTGVPVILKAAAGPDRPVDFVVNLRDGVPEGLEFIARVAEIIDADAARREAGRARFKAYRELGINPDTHKL